MIKYQLICDLSHEFEGWFQTSAAFDAQNQSELITCPVCGSANVRRALMTPIWQARNVVRNHLRTIYPTPMRPLPV